MEEEDVPTPSNLATFLIKNDIKVKFQSPQCGAGKQRARVRGDGTNLAEALGGATERHLLILGGAKVSSCPSPPSPSPSFRDTHRFKPLKFLTPSRTS